ALAFYRRALAFEPENANLFRAGGELLQRTERHEERVALYKSGLEHKFEPAERLKLLHTIAELERRELGRPDDAIETYRQGGRAGRTGTRAPRTRPHVRPRRR